MALNVEITEKSFGPNILYQDLQLSIGDKERVGIVGRNGTGKTTLFNIITGIDKDYAGSVVARRGTVIIASRQEHHGYDDKSVLEYILADLPEYTRLKHIIDHYPAEMSDSQRKMQEFSDALDRFAVLDYYTVEENITRMLADFQLDEDKVNGKLGNLSGGQKRFVELVKVQRSMADISLIDEPTNHMDYVAKEAWLEWFKSARGSVAVITHDRDVLQVVDRIIEIRDGKAFSFPGNYDAYLKTNASRITGQVNEYAVQQRRISNLREDIIRFQRMKEKSRDPGTISRFKSQENRARKELAELSQAEKPSFWIDRESAKGLNTKMTEAYDKHKAQNIKVRTKGAESDSSRLLVDVAKLSLGYGDEPLFTDINFQLREGERIRLHGRNGAGKSTLVRAILAKVSETDASSKQFAGTIAVERDTRIGVYEQEIAEGLLDMTLSEAIESVYDSKDLPITDQKIKQLLSDYLFNPAADGAVTVGRLSGGQKARLQLISMLAGDPQVLILDEPTNHLDLPSIEELENALADYHGAIIYISHDSYFSSHLGGTTIDVAPAPDD